MCFDHALLRIMHYTRSLTSAKTWCSCGPDAFDQLSKGDIPLPHVQNVFILREWVWMEKSYLFFFFKQKRIELKNSHTMFHACLCCGLFVRASESWEKAFSPGKNITQNGYFYFHVISWRMQSSIQLFFLHIAEETYLYQTWKLRIIASIFSIFNLILKTVVLYVMHTVILFIKLEWPSKTGKAFLS